jgi:hypothetical protein
MGETNRKMVLKCVLKKYGVMLWTGLPDLRWSPGTGPCPHSSLSSEAKKVDGLLHSLTDQHFQRQLSYTESDAARVAVAFLGTPPQSLIRLHLIRIEIWKMKNTIHSWTHTFKRHMAFRKAGKLFICSDKTWNFLQTCIITLENKYNFWALY